MRCSKAVMARLQTTRIDAVIEKDDDPLLGCVLSPDGPTDAPRRANFGESRSIYAAWQAVAFLGLVYRVPRYWSMQCHSLDFAVNS